MAISIPSGSSMASRLSGVAPCGVFFDASETTSTETSVPFHALRFSWNFGDSNSGAAWTTGTRTASGSKNIAYGPVAAHVFENAGTYQVTLTVFDGATAEEETIDITVSAWDGATHGNSLYVGNVLPVKGENGVPNDAFTFVAEGNDLDVIINTTANNGADYKRIFFKRGDTFTSNVNPIIDEDGPGHVGAYGTGNDPILCDSGSGFVLGNATNHNFGDWRFTGLNLVGAGGASGGTGILFSGTCSHILVSGNQFSDWKEALYNLAPASRLDITNGAGFLQPLYSKTFAVGNTFSSVNDYNWLLGANQCAIVGNTIGPVVDQHFIRVQTARKLVISNNNIGDGTGSGSVTIRGFDADGAGGHGGALTILADPDYPYDSIYTEQVVVSENVFRTPPAPVSQPITFRAINQTEDHRIRDVIFENNHVVVGAAGMTTTQQIITLQSQKTSIRNNIIDTSAQTGDTTIVSFNSPTNIGEANWLSDYWIDNNTFYSTGTTGFVGINAFEDPQNVNARNNLAYAPNATGQQMFSGTFGTGGTRTNNTANESAVNGVDDDPTFVAASGDRDTPAEFQLDTGSYAASAGTPVAVWDDYGRNIRDWQGGVYDLGAWAETTGTLPSSSVTIRGALGGLV